MIVRIVKNPVGLYNLSYDVGQEVFLPDAQGEELIDTGHAVLVEQKIETAVTKVKSEKAVRVRK